MCTIAAVRRLLAAGVCVLPGACVVWGACLATSAPGAPSVTLRAALRPELLGRSTTVSLGVLVAPGMGEQVPPPLLEGELRYPAGLNVQLSGLGIDPCHISALELFGLAACPADSVMGYGSATAELVIKRELISEGARIAVVRTDEQNGHPTLLFYIYGEPALSAQILLVVESLPAGGVYGGLLRVHVPLIPTFVEGPDVSVIGLRLVLGPKNLVYYERVHHRFLRYKPAGIPLAGHCPRKGFPFAVTLSFMGGAQAGAVAAVPCPRRRARAAFGVVPDPSAQRRAPSRKARRPPPGPSFSGGSGRRPAP